MPTLAVKLENCTKSHPWTFLRKTWPDTFTVKLKLTFQKTHGSRVPVLCSRPCQPT